jgi:hypothetical protein
MAKTKTSGFSETAENYLTRTRRHQLGTKSRNCHENLKINEGSPVALKKNFKQLIQKNYAVKSIKQKNINILCYKL